MWLNAKLANSLPRIQMDFGTTNSASQIAESFRKQAFSYPRSPLSELARVLVSLDPVARLIVNADHGIIRRWSSATRFRYWLERFN
jgi:hypothetical protein